MSHAEQEADYSDWSDYAKYRGKCKEMSEEAVAQDPSLRLVRGYYHCPFSGAGRNTGGPCVQTEL